MAFTAQQYREHKAKRERVKKARAGLIPASEKKQREAILPFLRLAVQAQIDRWDAERNIERILDRSLDSMSDGIEHLAVSCDIGDDVKIEDVATYLKSCEGVV